MATPLTIGPSGSPKKTDFTAIATNRKAPRREHPADGHHGQDEVDNRVELHVERAWLNVMSQCRRGTPKVPANVIESVKISMPPANRYGWIFANFQNATLR